MQYTHIKISLKTNVFKTSKSYCTLFYLFFLPKMIALQSNHHVWNTLYIDVFPLPLASTYFYRQFFSPGSCATVEVESINLPPSKKDLRSVGFQSRADWIPEKRNCFDAEEMQRSSVQHVWKFVLCLVPLLRSLFFD